MKKILKLTVVALLVLVLSLVSVIPAFAASENVPVVSMHDVVLGGVAFAAIVGVIIVAVSAKARRFIRGVLLFPLSIIGMAVTDGTYTKGLSMSQILHALGHYGVLRHFPIMSYVWDTIDVSGQTTERLAIIFKAKTKCYVKSAILFSAAALAASDTNYLTIALKNLTDTTALAATAPTTKVTGGTAIVAETAWTITVDQHTTLDAGDELELSLVPATNSVANDLTHVRVLLEISYDEADYIA